MNQKEITLLKGTCLTMCPHAEVQLRLKLGLGHKLEKRVVNGVRVQFADPQFMIKEFSRSSAGHEIRSSDVRPIPVLVKTVKYILTVICSLEDVSYEEVYDFVNNRLRSVHQDIVVQGTYGEEVIQMLSAAARFYVYSYYRLCENSAFDPHLNFQRLREIMLTVLPKIKESLIMNNNEVDVLTNEVNSLSIKRNYSLQFNYFEEAEENSLLLNSTDNETDKERCRYDLCNIKNCDEKYHSFLKLSLYEEIVSLHMLTNIGKHQVILDILQMPKNIRSVVVRERLRGLTGAVRNITNALVSYIFGNHMPLVRLASRLTPILAVALSLQLNEIQRIVLGAWSVAYNSVNLSFKVEDLKDLLLFSSEKSLIKTCHHYGIATSDAGVKFIKENFNWNVSLLPPEKAEWVEEKLNLLPLPQMLLGKMF